MIKDICGIYYIKNLKNGKMYIGQSVAIYREFSNVHRPALRHNRHHNIHLQRAWNKYGEENFEHAIIKECPESDLTALEIFYIKEMKSHQSLGGYNISWGGIASMRGRKHSPETIAKMKDGRRKGENHPLFGTHRSEETKLKIISNQPDFSNGKSPLIGREFSEEHKENLSKSLINFFLGNKHPRLGTKQNNTSSHYYGVTLVVAKKKYKYWRAQIGLNGKIIFIGQFKGEEDAARAYDEYIVKNNLPNPLNFPKDWGR
jgi:group I intron endonuclease